MLKKIKNVTIVPGCTTCGACEAACPKVFELGDIAHVKKGVNFNQYAQEIREAAEICPVSVIEVEEED